jgi:hypothetical protein
MSGEKFSAIVAWGSMVVSMTTNVVLRAPGRSLDALGAGEGVGASEGLVKGDGLLARLVLMTLALRGTRLEAW